MSDVGEEYLLFSKSTGKAVVVDSFWGRRSGFEKPIKKK